MDHRVMANPNNATAISPGPASANTSHFVVESANVPVLIDNHTKSAFMPTATTTNTATIGQPFGSLPCVCNVSGTNASVISSAAAAGRLFSPKPIPVSLRRHIAPATKAHAKAPNWFVVMNMRPKINTAISTNAVVRRKAETWPCALDKKRLEIK